MMGSASVEMATTRRKECVRNVGQAANNVSMMQLTIKFSAQPVQPMPSTMEMALVPAHPETCWWKWLASSTASSVRANALSVQVKPMLVMAVCSPSCMMK